MLSAPGANPAFCETFDQPAGIGDRSGDLNGTLWGVSRQLGAVNSGQGQWYDVSPTILQKCGQSVQVLPPHDVAICNGRLVEAQSDQGGVTSLAMYPKQPFDIAGRTGTIAFDVSDDSHGSHRAWPEIWYTDQPVPAPFDHLSSLQSVPRNGFGVRFGGFCPANLPGCGVRFICPNEPANVPVITVDSAVVVNNYKSNDSFMDVGTGTISVQPVGCVKASSGPGDMNHFELRVSQNAIDVYGTDAGTLAPLKKIAVIRNMNLTLTRGLIWLEDVHYNGDKDGPDQGTHTFSWDNVAFDGPILARDLAFDVLDRLTPVGPGYPTLRNLGWPVGPTDSTLLTLTVPGVYNVAQAAGALLTFNYAAEKPVKVSYRLNGGAWHEQPWPFGACYVQNDNAYCGAKTLAVPVPLGDVRAGANTIQLKASDYAGIANVDLVLVGAGGTGCTEDCPAATMTTLASSKNPATLHEAVTLTATVSSDSSVPAAGTVTFTDSGAPLGTAQLDGSGTAQWTTSSLGLGGHALVASYGGASGLLASESTVLLQTVLAAPPVTRFDWESGALDGWQVAWGLAVTISNSAEQAFSGTRSLRLNIEPSATHSAIAYEVPAEPSGFNPGTAVTLHVYIRDPQPITVYVYSYNEAWLPSFGAPFRLRPGWNAVRYVVPAAFHRVRGLGLQINNPRAESATLYLDAVTTP